MASSRPSTSKGVTGVSTRKKTLNPSEFSKLLGCPSDSDSDPGSDSEIDNLDDLYENGEAANYSSSDSETEIEIEPKRLVSKNKPGNISYARDTLQILSLLHQYFNIYLCLSLRPSICLELCFIN